MAEELKALQIACLCCQGAVVDVNTICVGGTGPEIVEVADTALITSVGDDVAVIDGCFVAAIFYITIVHAVHYHGLEVGRVGTFYIVVTHNTASVAAAFDIGKAEAVDNTGLIVQQTYDTSHIIATADGAAALSNLVIAVFIFFYGATCSSCQDTAVIDAGCTSGFVGNSAHIRAATDVDVV